MAFTLDTVVLWGRSFDEYKRMFTLTTSDLEKRILGCGDGPASFNAESTAGGGRVVSCDPIYAFSTHEIRQRIDETFQNVVEQAEHNAEEFIWTDDIPHAQALGRHRAATMSRFLADYEAGRQATRYVAASLPSLPFSDNAFDIAVCSHFLFLYSENLSTDFHLDSILEMIRVAAQVRIFPIVDLAAHPSSHLERVKTKLIDLNYHVAIETVDYEFQRGGHQMMRITR